MNRRRDLSEVVRYLCERQMDEGEAAWAEVEIGTHEAANQARSKVAKERQRAEDGTLLSSLGTNGAGTGRDHVAEEARTTRWLIAERFGVGRRAVEKGERIRRFDGGRFEP